MDTNFPTIGGSPEEWANGLTTELRRLFEQIQPEPIGALQGFMSGAVPSGWLECNGAAFNGPSYPYLARLFPTLILPTIATPFGAGTVVAIRAG